VVKTNSDVTIDLVVANRGVWLIRKGLTVALDQLGSDIEELAVPLDFRQK